MTTVRLLFPHQLFNDVTKLDKKTHILFIEDDLYFTQFPFHKQKLVLHRASMKQFAETLHGLGFSVSYIESAGGESMKQVEKELHALKADLLEYYDVVDDWLERRIAKLDFPKERFETPAFLTTPGQIEDYFSDQPNRMQQFYKWQRTRLNVLVEGGKPVGGKWSFDDRNRKKLPKNIKLPKPYELPHNKYVDEATDYIQKHFAGNPGDINSFRYPVDHETASSWLQQFLKTRFASFGPYEDAIDSQESQLFHSVLSPLINCGLLTPRQVLDEVTQYAKKHEISIESHEGFIRQIIGWREYMRATYVKFGREMRSGNQLSCTNTLKKAWWTGETGLDPVDDSIKKVLSTAYAHHIERLMVLGNALLLLRIHPDQVYKWFMSLFIDAYDWVMVPNVYAMSQFAAGDKITTKPYISGSNYIVKMSDYKKKGEWAEIWDALYWQFVADYRSLFEGNYRSSIMVSLYDRMADEKKQHIKEVTHAWLCS